MRKLSKKQRELLTRTVSGEDRQLLEQRHYTSSGVLDFVLPARRWFVPAGYLVPSGAAEYAAARALARRGLLKAASIPPSPELPYGNGGYALTEKGSQAA
jgi:hypothetical protein